ncbi:hypothetical protein [Phaffia rhodozyma]|uniref:Uncharacterized protein n=1 Tax=Phaffia rhodozyma TaxID=264483 RepID=A0A0F7SR81_PHARH|nr:hypothetical protein [Phaffia rhodozyma]
MLAFKNFIPAVILTAFASASVIPRAGAPITQQTLEVSNLTECGVANISWTGPGVEPYSLVIADGGYYQNTTLIASYENITGVNSFYWIVNQSSLVSSLVNLTKASILTPTPASQSFFEITDANNQKTHLQNLIVQPALNQSYAPHYYINGTFSCPAGTGEVTEEVAEAWE